MSGPKVVTIVTRDEIIAICQGLLASLQAALDHWSRVGKRNGVTTDADLQLMNARVAEIRGLLAGDQFDAIQKQVPQEIAFLKVDIEKRIERAAEKAAEVQMQDTRRIRAAALLANALEKKGMAVSPALMRPASISQAELSRAISEGFNTLSGPFDSYAISDRQRELAEKLGNGEVRLTLEQWLEHQPLDPDENAVRQLHRRFAELKFFDPNRAEAFEVRVKQTVAERSSRRSLLIDSLAADIAEARQKAVAHAAAIQRLSAIAVQLRRSSAHEAMNIVVEIDAALGSSASLSELERLVAIANSTLEEVLARQVDIDRRATILQGLAELGYEVQEGMQTAWVEKGKVVLRSQKSQGYGVEVGGDPSKAMQVRTVAFGPIVASNTPSDIAAETEFCGDFSKLQEALSTNGGSLSIIKALGVGTTPVKRVSAEAAARLDEVVEVPVTQAQRK